MLYIIAAIYGLLIGNYITTAYFRIPRSIPINGLSNKGGKIPHCSICNHKLKFYEYLPLLSWLSTGFKCNYCRGTINPFYTILEISMMLISLLLMAVLGINIMYSISVLIAAALVLNIALLCTYSKLYTQAIYIFAITLVLLLVLSR